MKVKVRKKGHVNIVECSGTMKLGNEIVLREAMDKLLDADERFYVFDMLKVPWMDTGGISEVVVAHKHVVDKEGKIVLALNKKLHDLFTITQLTRVFDVYSDVEEALGSFAR